MKKQKKEVRKNMYDVLWLKSRLLPKIFIAYNGRKVFDKIVFVADEARMF